MEKWVIKNRKADFMKIMEAFGVSEVLARCLVNKGIDDLNKIKKFLHPEINGLIDPKKMKDLQKSCDILWEKIKSKKHIRIIGDYDVDGVVATYILYRTLKQVGAKVDYEIPDRIKDGYGININMVEEAYKDQVDTILTCDNGIVAMEQVEKAKEYGMTVIITDHHNLYETEDGDTILPIADAIINPNQRDCGYPFKGLCGAAIAYKLMVALIEDFPFEGKEEYQLELLSYAAIATVCDVMDLVEENRIIVKCGLEVLRETKNLGLQALMEVCKIEPKELATYHLGFIIGPCLNASGRLDTAKIGLNLLLAENKEEALLLATQVRDLNNQRKDMTAENVEKTIELIENSSLKNDKVLVVYLEDCHESIAGIIAGRVKDCYHKPTVILTDSENAVKGSARSIESYNMIEELSKCRNLLLKLGGHPMAAGLSLERERVDEFRKQLNENATLTEEDLAPKVTIDILLPFGYISEELVQELKLLEPFGKGNERPLFAEKNVKIKLAYLIGKNGNGIRFRLVNQYGREMEALYFGDIDRFFTYMTKQYGEEEVKKMKSGRRPNIEFTITYYPRINEYNGFRNLQIMIQNYR